MSKREKKEQAKQTKLIGILLVLVALGLLAFYVLKSFAPFYVSVDRTKNVTETDAKVEDKVEGWLRVQGTNIDYPIILNDRYKKTDINNMSEYDFVWTNENLPQLTNRPLIVGHNIQNVSSNPQVTNKSHSRFEQLLSFVYLDFVEKNKYIELTIDGKNYLYKIFSIGFVDDETVEYFEMSFDKPKMDEYIKTSRQDSMYDFDVDVAADDNLITLVTCTRFFGYGANKDFKIDARMVHEKEKIENYKVTKNENYKEIEKIMKGDNEDEEDA